MLRTSPRIVGSTLLGLALAIWPFTHRAEAGPAAFGAPGTPDPAAAKAANERTAAAFKAKKFDVALAAAREAYLAGGGSEALEGAGVAALRLGQVSLAWACYSAILDDSTAPPGVSSRAKNQLDSLRGQTGAYTIESDPTPAKISVDGNYVGTTPLPTAVRMFPGNHGVAADFEGGVHEARDVKVAAGTEKSLKIVSSKPAVAAVVPVIVPVVAIPTPALIPPPPPAPVSVAAAPIKRPPPAPVSAAPAPVAPEPPPAEVKPVPVPDNPVMAAMHRLAIKLAPGMRAAPGLRLRRIAVVPFETTDESDKSKQLGLLSAELLSSRLVLQPGLVQVERQRMAEISDKVKRAEGGQVSPEGAAAMGKLLGANTIVLGSVGDAGAEFLMTARAVDVETGRILIASDETVPRTGLIALREDMVEVKSKSGAALRSAVVPGWGQLYNGDTFRGVGYMTLYGACAATAVVSAELGREAKNDYQKDSPSSVGRRADGNAHYLRVNYALAGMGVVWAAAIVDAYLTGHDVERIKPMDDAAGQ